MVPRLFTSCCKKVNIFFSFFFAIHSATVRLYHARDSFPQAPERIGPIHSPFLPQLSPILLTRASGQKNEYLFCQSKEGRIPMRFMTAISRNKFRSKKHLIKNTMALKIIENLASQIFLRSLERVATRRGAHTKKVQNDKDFQNFLFLKNITEKDSSFDPNSEDFLNVSPPEALFEGSPPHSQNIMNQQHVEKFGHKNLCSLYHRRPEVFFKKQISKKIFADNLKERLPIKKDNKSSKPMLSLFLEEAAEKYLPKNQKSQTTKNSKGLRLQKAPPPCALSSDNLERTPQFYKKEKRPSFFDNELSLQSLITRWVYREKNLLKKYEALKLYWAQLSYSSVPSPSKSQALYQLEFVKNALRAIRAEQRLYTHASLKPEFMISQLKKLRDFDRAFLLVFPLKFRRSDSLLKPTSTDARSCSRRTSHFCCPPLKPYDHPRIFSRNLPQGRYDRKNPAARPALISAEAPVCPYSDSMARFFEQIHYLWDQIPKIFCCPYSKR